MRRRYAIAAVVAIAVLLTGCQKVTKAVSTSISPCFRVLPQARDAVGKQGTLVDVTRLRGSAVTTLEQQLRGAVSRPGLLVPSGGASGAGAGGGGQAGVAPGGVAAGRRDVCVVTFRGTFDPSRVQHLIRGQSGRYAVVVVGSLTQRVRGVVLTNVLPPPLHAH